MFNVHRHGQGPIHLLFMHDWLSDCSSYDFVVSFLDPKVYTMHLCDLRGYGVNKEIPGRYTLSEATQDIADYLCQHDLTNVHLIGHSMGALIAQNIAFDHQDRVAGVIALTPIAPQGSPVPDLMRGFILAAAGVEDALALQMIKFMTSHRYHDYFMEKKLAKWRDCSTIEARLGYFTMFADTNISAKLKGLETPITVVTGRDDIEVNKLSEISEKFKSVFSNVSFVEMPCTHYPMLEIPVDLSRLIDKIAGKVS